MHYHFKVHKEGQGYWAHCLELPGCWVQADTKEHLQTAMSEGLNLYLAENSDSVILFPLPKNIKVTKSVLAIEVNPSVAVALSVRQARLKMGLTQKQMMAYLGIKNLSNYQRLEDPSRANPEFKTMVQLMKLLPDLNLGAVIDSYRAVRSKAS